MKAYEILGDNPKSPFIFSCEHASNALPKPIQPSNQDDFFLQSHWGIDIGAAEVLRHLIHLSHSKGILATHSRLWMDLNRHQSRPDIIREETEGYSLSFNQNLSPQAIEERFQKVYHPFHQAFDNLVSTRLQEASPFLLLSIHSFTPIWEGHLRTMDMGVLFDDWSDLARSFQKHLIAQGFFTDLNQPYTGKNGLMYSVQQPGRKYGVPHLELEINQMLISTPERAKHIAELIWPALQMVHQELV